MESWEIEWFIAEYAQAARALRGTGIDGIELHANHEDLLQLFVSPATNQRCPLPTEPLTPTPCT